MSFRLVGRSRLPLAWLLPFVLCCWHQAPAADASANPRQPIPAKVVVLTFDDSVKSHFTIARPLLKELGFHATFFITEGFDFPTNKQDYMTWDEIRQLHLDGFEIGNHTRDHMGITAKNLNKVREQLETINERCRVHGIPVPVSLAYPGNAFHPDALPILESMDIRYARRGGSPEYTYEEGGGVAYEPGRDHPLLIPSAGDARPNWSLDDFTRALGRARPGTVPVLQFHGVPDRAHPWVNTPTDRFVSYMRYLKTNGYTVLAMRDLDRFVGTDAKPANPQEIIDERIRQRTRKLQGPEDRAK
jgi:peptidoglycan/xylan/chitin deacetylase (PgdA/CDA1 family)